MNYIFTFTFLFFSMYVNAIINGAKLEPAYLWKQLEFDWPSIQTKVDAISGKRYIPENNLPLGLDRWRDKLFITVPRWRSGVAASLNYITITDDLNPSSPILHPYPSWEENTLPGQKPISFASEKYRDGTKATPSDVGISDNSTIISTFRLRVDECDRLWVMDTGLADILGNAKQFAQPAIVIFDLHTDRLIRRHPFPPTLLKEDSFLANIMIDASEDNCDNAHAYVPDLGGYSVIVYSFKNDKSWTVKHNFFHFDPLNGDYTISGINFQWTDGIFALALDSTKHDGSRDVYFHALSSTKEFKVSSKVLQNETYAKSRDSYYEYKLVGERGPNSQSSAEFLHEETGVLFYTQVNKDGVGCWNTRKPYTPENQGLVDSDSDALVFPNDLKVDRYNTLWVLSDRMPVYLYRKLNPDEFNYRILRKNVQEAILGTPCAN